VARSSSERVRAVTDDDVATQRLPPLRVITRRIDNAFGDGGPPSEAAAAQLQVVALRRPSLYPSMNPPGAAAESRWGTTAKWPPHGPGPGGPMGGPALEVFDCDMAPTSRSPISRPMMPPMVAAWAESAKTKRSADDSMLGAAVRALTEGAMTPANEAWPADDVDPDADPAFRRRACLRQLGPLDQVPRSTVASHEIRSMGLEHRQAFILSFADGLSSLEDIVESCGMEELDALEVLCDLVDRELLVLDLPS
jgi:hypothetical protein